MLVLVCLGLLVISNVSPNNFCPKQCDCDMDDGLNRATCVEQNIVNINVGVPKEVQIYSLNRNVISELDNFCFKEFGYQNIIILDLSYNLIFWIGLHAFSGLDKLVHLDLSNNRLRYIPSDLFWDTPQLKILDLSSNIFEQLKNEPFITHTKLEVLNLNNCRIKSLPERLFNRLPNLKKLDLSENYMVTLNLDVLRPLRKLERIELRNEYWRCNPDFTAVESWISFHNIKYEKQCKNKLPKMSEKMISMTVDRESVNINKVWNVSADSNITQVIESNGTKPLTPFQKLDRDFPAVQAFVIGLEIGLGIGIVCTYIWLNKCGGCSTIVCRRPISRRRRRMQRVEDMRTNLLWSNVTNPDLETPPFYRRQLSLPDRSAPYAIAGLQVDAIRIDDRSETPPPPYNECRLNI